MTLHEFEKWATENGWKKDRFGHFHKDDYRYKVQARSVRLEKGYHTTGSEYSRSEKRWVRLRSAPLSKLSISENGRLIGMVQ